jgi:hypothetical protein
MSPRAVPRFVLTVVIVGCASCAPDSPTVVPAAALPDHPDIVPQCPDPAPLLGEHDDSREGWPTDYLFTLEPAADGQSSSASRQRLKEKYHLYLLPTSPDSSSDTWFTTLSRERVALLRCEPEVRTITHTRVISVD